MTTSKDEAATRQHPTPAQHSEHKMTNPKDEADQMPDESGWSLDDAISWAKNHTLYQLGLVGNNGSAHAVTMLINHAEATRQQKQEKESK